MKRWIVPLFAMLLLGACGKPAEEQARKVDEGRAETRHLEAVDSVGYAGSGVRKKVDKALDANDERTGTLDEAIEKDSQ
jgi:hypothetical protein